MGLRAPVVQPAQVGVTVAALGTDGRLPGAQNPARVINVMDPAYGAKGDGKHVNDGAITTGTATLTSATAGFTAADVGKLCYVAGAGAAGAQLATTISAFTNSTTVTLAANASTTVSGAAVDYGTDDTAAINAAITAVPTAGATIVVPIGVFMVTSSLLIQKPNVVFMGQGSGEKSIIYDSPDTGGYGSCIKTNLNIDVFKVYRQAQGRFAGIRFTNLQVRGGSRSGTSIGIRTTSDTAGQSPDDFTTIDHCVVINLGTGIKLERSDACHVHDNWISENGNGIYYGDPGGTNQTAAVHANIHNNGIYDNNAYGIKVESCSRVKIADNQFARNVGPIIVGGAGTAQVSKVTVTGNIVRDPSSASAGIQLLGGTDCTVSKNHVAGGTDAGIVTAVPSVNCTISDNDVSGNKFGIYFFSGATSFPGFKVNNNRIYSNGRYGIYSLVLVDSQIHDNHLYGNGTETNNTYDQILLDSLSSNNSVQGNVCRKAASGNLPRYGIRINNANCTANLVTNNDLLNSGSTGGLSDVGTSTVTTSGNRAP
jgi:hypothetical protein